MGKNLLIGKKSEIMMLNRMPAAHYATGLQLNHRVASQLHNVRQTNHLAFSYMTHLNYSWDCKIWLKKIKFN
jgi:hypothetical protein